MALCLVTLLIGCASTSTRGVIQERHNVGEQIAKLAHSQVGIPYKWGGKTRKGFDCSGLVLYVYSAYGIEVPRTANEQFNRAQRVSMDRLRPGDLLFFKLESRRISHVAIYTGNGRMVHAPRSGKSVETSSIDDNYWRAYLVGAGRYL